MAIQRDDKSHEGGIDGAGDNGYKNNGRRKWDVPPGGIVTDGAGRLRRRRPDTHHHPWSAVPVGPKSAVQLGEGLDERDHLIMLVAERAHVITTEQVARAFFNSPVTARKRIRLLRERRFLVTPEVDHRMVSKAVGHRGGIHSAPLVLDWNGKYLLEHLGYQLRTWDAATVAQVNSRFGHKLAISEVWSYIVAAARATHTAQARAPQNGATDHAMTGIANGVRDLLAVGLLNERESVIYHEGCTGWSLQLEKANADALDTSTGTLSRMAQPGDWRPRPLVKPDATLVLSVTSHEASNNKLLFIHQDNWHQALLPVVPSPVDMRATEQMGHTHFRQLFLEMETGTNSSMDMVNKIERYKRLFSVLRQGDMMHGQSWRRLFGPTLPAILVAVRDRSQVEMQVAKWRTHFAGNPPGTVILANLEVLAQVYARGRSRLLTQPCWLDVMSQDGATWRPFSAIFGLRV